MRWLVAVMLTLTLSGCSMWLDYDSIVFEDDDAGDSYADHHEKDGFMSDAKPVEGGVDVADGFEESVAPRIDCNGVPNGTAVIDACGVCGGDGTSCADCKGIPNGRAELDVCGVCDGDGTSCLDCKGVVNGPAKVDACGVCDGDGKSCADCKGTPNGAAVVDACGVCDGKGASCNCSLNSFCDNMVKSHNKVRQSVNKGTYMGQPKPSFPIPNVTWDPKLAAVALNYAKKCNWVHNANRTADYAAQGGSGYVGENLGARSGTTAPSTDFTVDELWGNEAKDYYYSSNNCTPGKMCGHYTQVVWSKTLRIGCAVHYCNSWVNKSLPWSGMFTVCNYAPGGNYIGERPY